jgi:hypothetical protein
MIAFIHRICVMHRYSPLPTILLYSIWYRLLFHEILWLVSIIWKMIYCYTAAFTWIRTDILIEATWEIQQASSKVRTAFLINIQVVWVLTAAWMLGSCRRLWTRFIISLDFLNSEKGSVNLLRNFGNWQSTQIYSSQSVTLHRVLLISNGFSMIKGVRTDNKTLFLVLCNGKPTRCNIYL